MDKRQNSPHTKPQTLAPLQRYIENAPALARKVVNHWGAMSSKGDAGLLPTEVLSEFLALVDKACRYEAAMRKIDNPHGESVIDAKVVEVEETRLAFAREYKRLDDLTGSSDLYSTTEDSSK